MNKQRERRVGFTESEKYVAFDDLEHTGNFSVISPINLDYYGMEQCEPGYSFGPLLRVCYVMHMVTKGTGELRKNGIVYKVKAGDAFLIYPGDDYVYQASQEDPWQYMWIGFHGFQAEEMTRKAGFSAEHPVISVSNMDKLQKVMERMLKANDLTYVNDLRRMSALYELLAELIEHSDATVEQEKGKEPIELLYVRTAVNIIMNTYHNRNVKVSELAEKIGISRSYLSTIFKKEMHMSPQEFLICYRMERAVSLLTRTNNSINAIAAEVGYNDALTFSKVFKKRYGVSPQEYRKQETVLVKKSAKGDYTGDCPL
ncbi:MAG: AraC family transcriptional regulator [Muricoprocola sp.]